MKKKFLFLGLLFSIPIAILSMNKSLEEEDNSKDNPYCRMPNIKDKITLANKKKIKENPYCLIQAVSNKDVDLNKIKNLISAGADLNIQDNNGNTALNIAIRCKHIKAAKNLIDTADTNLNIQDNNGWTALHWAAHVNSFEIVKELINSGADLNIQNNNGETALRIAVDSKNTVIVQTLLDAGADADKLITAAIGELNKIRRWGLQR